MRFVGVLLYVTLATASQARLHTEANGLLNFLNVGQETTAAGAPTLDGNSTLTVGSILLHEGKDYILQVSTGASVTAPFRKIDYSHLPASGIDDKGMATLTIARPQQVGDTSAPVLRQVDAAIIFLEENDATMAMMSRFGNKTIVLSKENQKSSHTTAIILKHSAYKQVAKCPDGTQVTLTVHHLADTTN